MHMASQLSQHRLLNRDIFLELLVFISLVEDSVVVGVQLSFQVFYSVLPAYVSVFLPKPDYCNFKIYFGASLAELKR